MSKQRVLTGITPSGTPHLGNYAGMLRPAIAASHNDEMDSYFFLADFHALIKAHDPERVHRHSLEITATWLAAGLDPDKVVFYRQSDIPEIPELNWILSCVSAKGLLNRAHAYKAAQDQNEANGEDPDAGITMGLFNYPVLMAADILMFNSNLVPVGKDQIQHIEMARDIVSRFNHLYGELFVLPDALIEANVAVLPGLDGRKMSKSYGNVIPLFASSQELRKLVFLMLTDSRAPGEPKETEDSIVFQFYQAFAGDKEVAEMRTAFADGISWADAKAALFESIDQQLTPLRARYAELIQQPDRLEKILREGAEKARAESVPMLKKVREAVGLRPLNYTPAIKASGKQAGQQGSQLHFKQYREADGNFYFKLVDGQQRLLAQSIAFASPRDAGLALAALKEGRAIFNGAEIRLQDALIATLATGIEANQLASMLATLE